MTTNNEERVLCKTPNPGKQGTRIPKSKYDLIRGAIRRSVPKGTNGIELKDLSAKVKQNLSAKQRNDLGSVSWHFMHVKLDLEVRGELERIPGSSPQRATGSPSYLITTANVGPTCIIARLLSQLSPIQGRGNKGDKFAAHQLIKPA